MTTLTSLPTQVFSQTDQVLTLNAPSYSKCQSTTFSREVHLNYVFFDAEDSSREALQWISFDAVAGRIRLAPTIEDFAAYHRRTISVKVQASIRQQPNVSNDEVAMTVQFLTELPVVGPVIEGGALEPLVVNLGAGSQSWSLADIVPGLGLQAGVYVEPMDQLASFIEFDEEELKIKFEEVAALEYF